MKSKDKMERKLKLKVGDWVWTKIPINAKIIRVTKFGYVLSDNESLYSYYDDSEVIKLGDKSK